jgi:hypothetical protein
MLVDHRQVERTDPGEISHAHQKVCDIAVDGRPYLGSLKIDLGSRKSCFGAGVGGFGHLRVTIEHLIEVDSVVRAARRAFFAFLTARSASRFRIVALALSRATLKSNFSMT